MRVPYPVLLILAMIGSPASAEPGTVKGTVEARGKAVELKYSYAHLHDNAEGLLTRPRELRILLSDREVPPDALHGISWLRVEDMAMEGKVQGLLLELDPAKPDTLVAVLLARPAEAGLSLQRTTH